MATDNSILFPPFRLELANEQLWQDETLIPLRPKPFAVLRYLVEHPGRLVTREELQKAIWLDTYVSEGLLRGYVRELRSVLGDDANAPRFIETISRRGYRFLASTTPLPAPAVSRQLSVVEEGQTSQQGLQLATGDWQLPAAVVGREAELTQLYNWLEKAASGERQLVFVTGEPGIGKTTLIDAFLKDLRQQATSNRQQLKTAPTQLMPDARSLSPSLWIGHGQCVEHYGAGEAYLPVLEAFGRLCRQPDGEQLVEVLYRYAPTWLVQMPPLVSDTDFEALQRKVQGAARERMLRELAETIEAFTADRLLVLVLEDLHWCDYSTLDLLGVLTRRRGLARLFVIGTYRPADVIVSGHPLRGLK